MPKRRKKKSADKLEAQARAHEALYGSDWREVTEYRKQALEIIERYGIRSDDERIDAEELRIFKKRLDEFREGRRRMHGELPFYKVLRLLAKGGAVNPDDEIEAKNLRMLGMLGYIKDGKLTWKGRDMMKRIRR
ncbi:MAG: hypothetical protein JSW28_10015 [Thermoplasmata archaeon]|nr:MAG: hypothetical protein JSW28_10015 [Thermoplasmata archaeon]